jgi:hypothetical protein
MKSSFRLNWGWVLAMISITGCTGPRPELKSYRLLAPQSSGDPYIAELKIENRGSGGGEISAEVRLRDKHSGAVIHQKEQLTMQGRDVVLLHVPVQAPRGDYTLESEVQYPTP